MPKKKFGVSPIVQHTSNASGVSVPAGVNGMWLTMVGAGGGGGSGRRGASLSTRYGGEGGQGGYAIYDLYIPRSLLGSTYSVTVPSTGGAGGPAATVNSTNGNAGTTGSSTIFTTGSITWTCIGGAGGQGGGTAAQTTSMHSSLNARGRMLGGYGGLGINGTGMAGYPGDFSASGGGGGGGGGGVTSGNVAGNGGSGGRAMTIMTTQSTGGIVGGAGPTAGGAGPLGFAGGGAGGGAGATSGVGQTGANAVGYGGGGGGGGASTNSSNSGAGGSGAPGFVRIIWDYRTTRQQRAGSPYAEYSDTTSLTSQAIPSGIRGVWVFMIGPGGGGGSGSKVAAGGTKYGGQGGYGGHVVKRWIPASLLGSTYDVTIPSRRTGGAGVTLSNADGNSGQAYDSCEFASGSFSLWCDGGLPGAGGTAATASWPGMDPGPFSATATGGPGAPSGFSWSPTINRVAGGQTNTYMVDNDANGWQDYGGPGGGGAGGYISSGTPFAGSDGGFSRAYGQSGGDLGDGVSQPGSGPAAIAMVPGAGGGGGSASTSGGGQSGADATGYGGGGGGGGAALNGFTSGAGGMGGPGYIRLTWDFI